MYCTMHLVTVIFREQRKTYNVPYCCQLAEILISFRRSLCMILLKLYPSQEQYTVVQWLYKTVSVRMWINKGIHIFQFLTIRKKIFNFKKINQPNVSLVILFVTYLTRYTKKIMCWLSTRPGHCVQGRLGRVAKGQDHKGEPSNHRGSDSRLKVTNMFSKIFAVMFLYLIA
jgi:hypothetical protein